MTELSENKFTQYRIEGDAIVLAKILTMSILVGRFYEIAKSKKWNGANYCRVIKFSDGGAICEVAKTNARTQSAQWEDGEFSIPFDKFTGGPF